MTQINGLCGSQFSVMSKKPLMTRALCLGLALLVSAFPAFGREKHPIMQPTMNIVVRTIPMSEMRYPTVGDWWFDHRGNLQIRVAKMSDWRYEALIAGHEQDEALLCAHAGITDKRVDAFDKAYEAARKPGDLSEPGDDPAAPYHDQHKNATVLEVQRAAMLGVNWAAYNAEVESK